MVKQVREILTESERNRIRGLHEMQKNSDVVFTDWLSPDEKYCIFLDELYDIENKSKIGNIWENFDNFKFFLRHSFEVAENVPQQIKEDVLQSLDKLVLTESTQNLSELKPIIKQLIEEGFFGDLWDKTKQVAGDVANWGKETVKGAVKGVKDFASTSWEGMKKAYSYIKDGDWSAVLDLIKKGMLYVARKIRSAMYNPIGLLLDAILVATGIGKSAQFVIWAVIVALDVYEIMTGNYEDPDLSPVWRYVFLGVDILGLVFAGVAAKTAKGVVGGLIRQFGKSTSALSKAVQSSKPLQGILQKISGGIGGASSLMQRAATYLQKNAPKIYNFLSGAFNGVGKVLNTMGAAIKGLFNVGGKVLTAPGKLVGKVAPKSLQGTKTLKGAQAAANIGVPLVGIGAYGQGKKREYEKAAETGLSDKSIESEYVYDDL